MMTRKEKILIYLLKHLKYFLLYDILLILLFIISHKAIYYFLCAI